MTLPRCQRCNQYRTSSQLRRGICDTCRAHQCDRHQPGRKTCYSDCGCRCGRCTRAWYRDEKRRKLAAANGHPRLIPAVGTQRRIQALWALGWDSETIGRAAGISGRHVWQIAGNRELVREPTARAIASAYDRLSMRPGPSSVTRRRATAAGYPPPLAWDDIDTDTAPHAATSSNRGATAEDVAWMAETGESLLGIQRRTGLSISGIEQTLKRSDREDLWRQIMRREAA